MIELKDNASTNDLIENEYKDSLNEDIEYLKSAKEGDLIAVEKIFLKYSNMVRLKARPYFLAGADYEDLIQEGMIGLFKAIRDYDFERVIPFKNFAEICVTRQIITAVRKYSSQKHQPLNSYISLNRPINDDGTENTFIEILSGNTINNPESLLINREQYVQISERIMDILSKFEKTVFKLYMAGMSYDEISDALDKDYKAIDNALQRIKKKINKFIKENKKNNV